MLSAGLKIGCTNASTITIAEKGSDMILQDARVSA